MITHLSPYSLQHLHNTHFLKTLGKGHSGSVKLAKCTNHTNCSCNKLFIIKQFKKNYSSKHILYEFTIGTLLHHPNISSPLDIDIPHKSIIFDFSPSIDFFKHLSHNKNIHENISYFKQIIQGVSFMHNVGIAHMDLKLENIIIDLSSNLVKIIDFGESRIFHDSTHITDVIYDKGVHGTVPYMPPEEFLSPQYDPSKCDIWSLGIILYYIVYDSSPWYEASTHDNRYNYFSKYLYSYNHLPHSLFSPTSFTLVFTRIFVPNPFNRCDIKFLSTSF